MTDPYQPALEVITFPSGKTAQVLRTLPTASANDVARWLNLPSFRFSIVLHGGAGDMSEAHRQKMLDVLCESVVRFAEDNRALVVDGGTDIGIMQVMGEAYRRARATFPLVGVTVADSLANGWELNESHSHFVLVEANDFGAESQLLVGFARILGSRGVALTINGGDITRAETEMQARLGTPIICIKGSGRYADSLANAAPDSPLRQPFEENATALSVFDIDTQPPEELYRLLRGLLYS